MPATSWPPTGTSMIIASHTGFVGKHYQYVPGVSACLMSGGPLEVAVHKASVMHVDTIQRSLEGEAQPLHHLARHPQVQHQAELAFDNLANDAKCPQGKLESKLIRGLVVYLVGDPPQLSGVAF
jgi:hypothetical protein